MWTRDTSAITVTICTIDYGIRTSPLLDTTSIRSREATADARSAAVSTPTQSSPPTLHAPPNYFEWSAVTVGIRPIVPAEPRFCPTRAPRFTSAGTSIGSIGPDSPSIILCTLRFTSVGWIVLLCPRPTAEIRRAPPISGRQRPMAPDSTMPIRPRFCDRYLLRAPPPRASPSVP